MTITNRKQKITIGNKNKAMIQKHEETETKLKITERGEMTITNDEEKVMRIGKKKLKSKIENKNCEKRKEV